MSDDAPGPRAVRWLARVVGVLGGGASAAVVLAMFGMGLVALMDEQSSGADRLALLVVLVLSPILLLLLWVSVRAVIDALRGATGGPALRIGSTWALLWVLTSFMLIDSCRDSAGVGDGIIVVGGTGVLALLNMAAYFMMRPRPEVASR